MKDAKPGMFIKYGSDKTYPFKAFILEKHNQLYKIIDIHNGEKLNVGSDSGIIDRGVEASPNHRLKVSLFKVIFK